MRQIREYSAVLFLIMGIIMMGKSTWVGSKAIVAQILLNQAWKTTLQTGAQTQLWASMDAKPIAKITVPALNREAIILEGSSGQALAFGPAHVSDTPLPGQPGVSIIAAHKNTHFGFIKQLKTDDIFTIQLKSGLIQNYKITHTEIVHYKRSNIPVIGSSHEPSRIALVTCYPFNRLSYGGPLRYVVYAELA